MDGHLIHRQRRGSFNVACVMRVWFDELERFGLLI
jgi:hypothetical protein